MHFTAAALAAVFCLPTYAGALVTRDHGRRSPRVLQLTTERSEISDPIRRDQLRRRGTVRVDVENKELLYTINFTLGTPPQTLRASLDTGSSDLWVNTPSSELCEEYSNPCASTGTFVAGKSSTNVKLGSQFDIQYVDGTSASGDYVTDTIVIGGTTLENFQFGLASNSTSPESVFGVGYPLLEAQADNSQNAPYQNLPAKLVAVGAIASSTYSLWLNDLDANTGSILFGGIDTEKYFAPLQTLPIQAGAGPYEQIKITLTGVSFNNTDLASNLAYAVLLDAGSSLTYLPDTIVTKLYAQVGAQYDSSWGGAYIPCSMAQESLTVKFNFSSPTISVRMSDLVLNLTAENGVSPHYEDGSHACLFGIVPAGAGTIVLGDTFLRSAYVVVDLDKNQVSLGQTKFSKGASNIVEIPKDGQVPGATVVSNPVTASLGVAVAPGQPAASSINNAAAPLSAHSLASVVAILVGICSVLM